MSIASTTIYPAWLPSLFVISPWTEQTFEDLYAIFKKDFLDNPANYCGQRVWLFPEKERAKEVIFWHLVERENKELGGRVADHRRAERLPWARPMLDNLTDCHIMHWDYEEGDKTIKTYIWLKDFDYLIVLKRMPDISRRLITSFYIEYPNKRRDLERKYKQAI